MFVQIVAGVPEPASSVREAGSDVAGITIEATSCGSIIINIDDGDAIDEQRENAAVRLSVSQAEVLSAALAVIVKEAQGVA